MSSTSPRRRAYQSAAAGLVKSTSAMPVTQKSFCHTAPSFVFTRYPFSFPSSYRRESWLTYGLIHTQMRVPSCFNSRSMASGSPVMARSHWKSHRWYGFIHPAS